MAEEKVMASVRTKVLRTGGAVIVSPISLKKYLDTDDISTPDYPLSITVNASGDSIPLGGVTSDAAATLINAINAIPTDQTIQTIISISATYGYASLARSTFTIIIDWTNEPNGRVTWNGSQTSEASPSVAQRYNGSAQIPGNVEITSLDGTQEFALMLGTTSDRKISRLPIPGLSFPLQTGLTWMALSLDGTQQSWDGFVDVDYVITTDTGTTIIAAPTPPAAPVVGVKISELPPAPSLQDDDLFVLSQDKPDNEIYDINYRVTLARLKAALSTSFQSGKWVADNTLSISTTNVTSCRISIATGLFDSTDTGSIMGQFDVSSKSLSLTQVYNGGAGSAPATPEGKTKTLTDLFQDMDIQPGSNGVIVTAKFDADTLSIKLAGTNMRGTYLIALS